MEMKREHSETMGDLYIKVPIVGCLKTSLFIFSILFWITGLMLLTLGLWALSNMDKYVDLSVDFSDTVPYVLIGIAVLIILITSISFSCIIKGQPVLLYIYAGFLACISVMDIGLEASAVCYRDTFAKALHDGLTETITAYDPRRANFDFVQSNLHCCGVNNYTDWMRLSTQRVIPISCCLDLNHCVTANYSDVYQRGCYEMILEYLEEHSCLLLVLIMFTTSVPLLGASISCALATFIKKSKYDAMY